MLRVGRFPLGSSDGRVAGPEGFEITEGGVRPAIFAIFPDMIHSGPSDLPNHFPPRYHDLTVVAIAWRPFGPLKIHQAKLCCTDKGSDLPDFDD